MTHAMKPKESILSPEDMLPNVKYTLTINPNDSFQFWDDILDPYQRVKKATNHMRHVIRQNPNFHMDLQMEISRNGRLHWHGTILFKTDDKILEFFLGFVHEFLTKHTMEIDIISTIQISKKWKDWDEYCLKGKRFKLPRLETAEVCKTKMVNPKKIYKTMDEFAE